MEAYGMRDPDDCAKGKQSLGHGRPREPCLLLPILARCTELVVEKADST